MKKSVIQATAACIAILATSVITLSANNSLKGDVDLNGKVTSSDAVLTLKYVIANSTGGAVPKIGEAGKQNADMNGDGKITALDASLILRYAVALTVKPNLTYDDFLYEVENPPFIVEKTAGYEMMQRLYGYALQRGQEPELVVKPYTYVAEGNWDEVSIYEVTLHFTYEYVSYTGAIETDRGFVRKYIPNLARITPRADEYDKIYTNGRNTVDTEEEAKGIINRSIGTQYGYV